jgi:flagellar capping protein FliD
MDREWTDKRTDDLADRLGRFEGNVDQRFDKVDQRFDRFEAKVDQRFEKLDSKMDKMTRRLTQGLITVVGAVFIKVFLG